MKQVETIDPLVFGGVCLIIGFTLGLACAAYLVYRSARNTREIAIKSTRKKK